LGYHLEKNQKQNLGIYQGLIGFAQAKLGSSRQPGSSLLSFTKKEVIEASSGSDDEENGLTRKRPSLFKEQPAFLEESFKEHNTLYPVNYNLNKTFAN
jgi:hypothetical protein